MLDGYKRKIDYLRVSVTDRCNLRCQYCMPASGVDLRAHEEILSYEELLRLIGAAVACGFSKIRLTGGEPLVRKNIAAALIAPVAAMDGVEDISMTTNALLLPALAEELKAAGLNRINISLDTLDPEKYAWLTRMGNVADALAGLDAAIAAGFAPVKVNALALGQLKGSFSEVARLSVERPIHVRFIEYMPIGNQNLPPESSYLPMKYVIEEIEADQPLEETEGPKGWGPAVYKRIPGAMGTIGFIRAESHEFCENCNRMRITSDGRIRGCLFASGDTSIRDLLRSGASQDVLVEAFSQAIAQKPKARENLVAPNQMSSIGG